LKKNELQVLTFDEIREAFGESMVSDKDCHIISEKLKMLSLLTAKQITYGKQ